jgi:peptidoglycan/LPS O-acetylase OafA/YrhL
VTPFYRRELDILRFAAFLMVFSGHVMPTSPATYAASGLPQWVAFVLSTWSGAGGFGVDVFFALSAYLITELLLREHRRTDRIDVSAFYVRRALRIWPLYFVFLIGIQPAFAWLVPTEHLPESYRAAFLLLGGNWAAAVWGFPLTSVASPLWSVSIEEQFYLLWPLVVKFARDRMARVAWLMLIIATLARIALVAADAPYYAVWCNTFARLDPIAGGILLACALDGRTPRLAVAARVGMVGAATVIILWAGSFGPPAGRHVLWTLPAVAVASTVLIFAFLHPPTPSGRVVTTLGYLGKISYGLYVFHMLAIKTVEAFWPSCCSAIPFNWSAMVVTVFLVTVALAAASYRWLETPFLRLKERYTRVPSRAV